MDFAGQKVVEHLNFYILVASAFLAFVVGYVSGSFSLLVKIYAFGLLLDAAFVVPNWPWLNKHPLEWLPPKIDQENPKKLG